jgi:predicted NodU family carbamoyl transferase
MQYSKSILITLGHNSSVIYFGGIGAKPIGFEEERLSKKKSDSSYPKLALEKVISLVRGFELDRCNVFISHWFDNFEMSSFPSKYFDHKHFNDIAEKYKLTVIPLSSSFTHHDAHAYSTLAFAENFPTVVTSKKHHIVVDGFGNNQEVISIYEQITEMGKEVLVPINRVYGYENSLGLMYQYATSFTGMKENQDEYKFLGYESAIKEVLTANQIEALQIRAYEFALSFMKKCLNVSTKQPEVDYVENQIGIDIDHLGYVKDKFHSEFQDVVTQFCKTPESVSVNGIRTIIGFYVQACLEQCLLRIISKYDIKNAYLSGGCFLNVKLNKVILDNITGYVCVNPLCGDQGAAIGMFRKYTNDKFDFADLCYGVRDKMKFALATKMLLMNEGIYIKTKDEEVIEIATHLIAKGLIVNLIRSEMEFGPRALCNTSTLALPTAANSAYINKVNNRNEVMPMAPVMLKSAANILLNIKDVVRVIGSNKFMIITHDYAGSGDPSKRGILHNKPLQQGFTCRPQIIDDSNSVIGRILGNLAYEHDCLINTSFNTHGTPILYSFRDAIEDFRKQKKNDPDSLLTLIIKLDDQENYY